MEDLQITCPGCGASVSQAYTFCPHCGHSTGFGKNGAENDHQEHETHSTPGVVYVQPPATREASWGPWLALTIVAILAVGVLLWNQGYLGAAWESTEPSATSVTIDNSPQMTSAQQPEARPPDMQNQSALPPAQPQPPPQPQQPEPEAADPVLDIISINGQPMETVGAEWKYSYTMKVRNNTLAPVTASFRVQFLDAQKFPVDDDLMENILIPANTEIEVSDYDMIPAGLAERVESLLVEQR